MGGPEKELVTPQEAEQPNSSDFQRLLNVLNGRYYSEINFGEHRVELRQNQNDYVDVCVLRPYEEYYHIGKKGLESRSIDVTVMTVTGRKIRLTQREDIKDKDRKERRKFRAESHQIVDFVEGLVKEGKESASG